jgi:UDPglucose 6-dehydrogenase
MRVAVVGSGYVGLVAGACFASVGNDVWLIDIDPHKVELLRQGRSPIFEPGLEELLRQGLANGRLHFTTQTEEGVAGAEAIFLAVGTPSRADGSVDLRYVEAAARAVGRGLTHYAVVVNKSTVPVGTTRRVAAWLAEETTQPFDVASNPEFLKEGAALEDFFRPDRVVLGVTSERARQTLRALYQPFMAREDRILEMDPISAELTKYACNAMLASRVSFMNELSRLAEVYGADIDQIRRGMGSDQRIGPQFLYASLGYGGSCFPKDVRALVAMGQEAHQPMQLIEAVQRVNDEQRERLFRKISAHFGHRLHGVRFAVWGLAFKARTDDVRESAAITIVQRLIGAGAEVTAHDPQALETARALLGDRVSYTASMTASLEGAAALVICTEWQDYRMPDLKLLRHKLSERTIFDGRNLYPLDRFQGSGLRYVSIGRPVIDDRDA